MLNRLTCLTLVGIVASAANAQYTATNLVANDPVYEPLNLVDPLLQNGWGLALRPPGAGGHFWVSNNGSGTTTTYVGDVHNNGVFTPLHQDSLTVVGIPNGIALNPDTGESVSPVSQPTGQVYNYSTTDFVVSGEGITGASKFIFVSGEGTISGWTEVRDENGILHRQTQAVLTVDNSHQFDDERLLYTGCAVTDYSSGNRLYVTNWTGETVEVYDQDWQPVPLPPDRFRLASDGETWRPWNIQYLRTGPNGEGRLWVAFNLAEDPWEEYPDFGAVAEFDLDGNLIRRLTTTLDVDPFADSELRDPWGLAVAPENFGPLSGTLLVANFGDGTIPAFSLTTGHFVDFVRDDQGEPIVVDGIWGIAFGNGVGLGDTDALYFAAGPNGEVDGTFGTVRLTSTICPIINQQPVGTSTCGGDTVSFSVEAVGPAHFSYQWRRNGVVIEDGTTSHGSTLAGAQTSQLTITDTTGDDAGLYDVVLTNGCGDVISDSVQLVAPVVADANCDGAVNNFDIDAFVIALTNPDSESAPDPYLALGASQACWSARDCWADANADGAVNNFDIDTFVELLVGG